MTASQTTTGGLVRLRHHADRFEAHKIERHPFGVVATGRFRHAQGGGRFHYYPAGSLSFTWPWKQVLEIREEPA